HVSLPGARMNRNSVFHRCLRIALVAGVLGCAAFLDRRSDGAAPSAAPPEDAQRTRHVQNANARAEKLLQLDDSARREFQRQHPGALPETPLKLPTVDVPAFDWCNLHRVLQAHTHRASYCRTYDYNV